MGSMSAASSPCVKICIVDPTGAICTGCGRTLAEIGGWTLMSDAEREAVLRRLREAADKERR